MAKKRKSKAKRITNVWVVIVLAIAVYVAQLLAQDSIPSQQHEKIADIEKIIIPQGLTNETHHYTGFSVYFNSETHIPNCTVYELTREEAQGKLPRDDNFHQDENIAGCASLDDYKFSGYDRGHMVPAGDMKWNKQAMNDCFSLANMIPQKKALNSGAWNKLEQKVRNWAERDSALIVITGPIVTKEDLEMTIGKSEVVVPSSIFKVILAPYTTPMRAIAFIYPNKKANGGLDKHLASVDDVENATGMDFFSALPDDIENSVEATSDLNQWNIR